MKMSDQCKKYTYIYNQYNGFYHNYAAKQGFADAAFWILYLLCKAEEPYTQYKLAEELCVPKQTINSAIAKLVKDGYVELRQCKGVRQGKYVELTEKGNTRCNERVIPLLRAEEDAMAKMTEKEVEILLKLYEKRYLYLCDAIYSKEDV